MADETKFEIGDLGFGLSWLVFAFWIPFGDHPLKLERYRED